MDWHLERQTQTRWQEPNEKSAPMAGVSGLRDHAYSMRYKTAAGKGNMLKFYPELGLVVAERALGGFVWCKS